MENSFDVNELRSVAEQACANLGVVRYKEMSTRIVHYVLRYIHNVDIHKTVTRQDVDEVLRMDYKDVVKSCPYAGRSFGKQCQKVLEEVKRIWKFYQNDIYEDYVEWSLMDMGFGLG